MLLRTRGRSEGVNILRLARSREKSLLAGVADDAHGSGVLCADSGSDRPPWQHHQSRDWGRDVRSSTAKRPSARPSCRSGRASARPWLPGRWQMAVSIQCHSNGRAPQICNLDISVAGEAGTRRRWGRTRDCREQQREGGSNSKGRAREQQGNSKGTAGDLRYRRPLCMSVLGSCRSFVLSRAIAHATGAGCRLS